ncbi:hypothetical protein D3C85_964300 [compost metagenome]
MDVHYAAVELLGHRVLLFGGGGDQGVHVADLGDGAIDAVDAAPRFPCQPDALLHLLTAQLHGVARFGGALLQQRYHLADLGGGGLGTLGQGAHFVRDDRKTTPLLASPGRLDGRVECQQVGLLRDAANDIQHHADAGAVRFQLRHHSARLLYLLRDLLYATDGAAHHLIALGRGAGGLLGRAHGIRGIAGHLIHGGLHLVHGGGHLGDLALLAGHALGGLFGDGAHLLHRAAELAHRARDLAHQARQRPLHPVDGRAKLTQLVAVEAAGADPLLQLPLAEIAARDALGLTGQHDERVADLAGQHHGEADHQHQTDQQGQGDAQFGGIIGRHHHLAGGIGIAMVDAHQVANRLGQVGVEGDPLPHEEVLGLGHLP